MTVRCFVEEHEVRRSGSLEEIEALAEAIRARFGDRFDLTISTLYLPTTEHRLIARGDDLAWLLMSPSRLVAWSSGVLDGWRIWGIGR